MQQYWINSEVFRSNLQVIVSSMINGIWRSDDMVKQVLFEEEEDDTDVRENRIKQIFDDKMISKMEVFHPDDSSNRLKKISANQSKNATANVKKSLNQQKRPTSAASRSMEKSTHKSNKSIERSIHNKSSVFNPNRSQLNTSHYSQTYNRIVSATESNKIKKLVGFKAELDSEFLKSNKGVMFSTSKKCNEGRKR